MAEPSLHDIKVLEKLDHALSTDWNADAATWDTLGGPLAELRAAMVEGDAMLKAMIPYFSPPHPRPDTDIDGDIELGIVPFWAKHPDKIPYYQDIPHLITGFLKLLQRHHVIPEPTITEAEYSHLHAAAIKGTAIGPDGTSWGINPYEQLDYHWLEAPINALLVKFYYGKYKFPNTPAHQHFGTQETSFAVTGDWGTGAKDAISVRKAAMVQHPDYLMHLGDVYYTGTPKHDEQRLFAGPGMELAHLVNFWPQGDMKPGRSFTMNSNHEMYPGGWGLFEDALSQPLFAHQNGCSYGLLESHDWQIFYLDSAYDSPDFLYMYGALTDDQITFVQDKAKSNKRKILMTHHTPFDLTGKVEQVKDGKSLLRDVGRAFGCLPDYWYFGHIHDGIVYAPKTVPASTNGPAIPGTCNMRCAGHASMPYGAPWGLAKPGTHPPFKPSDYIDGIDFFAGTPKGNDPAGLVKNGFMTFTLTGNKISEAFFDENGQLSWSSALELT